MALHAPAIDCLKSEVSIRFVVSYVQTVTNQELFEKHFCNQSSHYEKYRQFPLRREAIMRYHQIDTFQMNGTQRSTLVSP